MFKPGRILLIVAISAVLCALYVWFLGAATMFALEARYIGWKTPGVRRTPVELQDLSITQATERRLTYFGYEFKVPWEVDEAKTKQIGRMQRVAFRSGNTLLVSRTEPKEFANQFVSKNPAVIRGLYGEEALKSDYLVKQLILEATPDKVGLLTPRREAVGRTMLLVIKGAMIPGGGESGIYRIQTGNFRGFQFGDPQSRPTSIHVEIYDEDSGLGFVFTQRENGSVPPITQAEINRVVQSVRKSSNQY